MRDLINLVEDSHGKPGEHKYWIIGNSLERVDNHDMWIEDNYAEGGGRHDQEHYRALAFRDGLIRLWIERAPEYYDELVFEYNARYVGSAELRAAIDVVNDETGIEEYRINNLPETDDPKKIIAQLRLHLNQAAARERKSDKQRDAKKAARELDAENDHDMMFESQTLEPQISEDDGDVPNALCAFFDDDCEVMIRYWRTEDQLVLQTMHSGPDVRGRDMLRWLKAKYRLPIAVVDATHEAFGFWERMEEEGLVASIDIADGMPSPLEDESIPFPG